ncbi:MAG: hypothetical protein RR993_00110 [Clostridia bacterium]
MKKSRIILLISIILVVCLASFAGCKPKDLKAEEIFALASATSGLNLDTTIVVKDGVKEVYTFKDGVSVDNTGLGLDEMSFGGAGNGLPFAATNLEETTRSAIDKNTSSATYNITNPQELLGEAGATNGVVVITYAIKEKALQSMSITYTAVRGELSLIVEITVKTK